MNMTKSTHLLFGTALAAQLILGCGDRALQSISPERKEFTYSLMLTPRAEQLANIQVMETNLTEYAEASDFQGEVTSDPSATRLLTSLIPGRIERMYVTQPGDRIHVGQPVADLYSPEIESAAAEYIRLAKGNGREEQELAQAARIRLMRLGIQNGEIENWKNQDALPRRFVVRATQEGTVSELPIAAGNWINRNATLAVLANDKTPIVKIRIDANQKRFLTTGTTVYVAGNGWTAEGRVRQIDIENNSGQTFRSGFIALNKFPERMVIGEIVNVSIHSDTRRTIRIPTDAILNSSGRKAVFVSPPEGGFEFRAILTGRTQDGRTEITRGIKPGDKLVVQGAYLLYSELVLRNHGDLPFPEFDRTASDTKPNP